MPESKVLLGEKMSTKAKTTTKLEHVFRDFDERARGDIIVREFDDDCGVNLGNNPAAKANLIIIKHCALP